MNFIRFLCNEWKNIYFRSKLEGTEMYLAYDEQCFRVTTQNVEEVSYLRCNHEEADTRIFLHTKDASQSKDAIVVICEDTDTDIKSRHHWCSHLYEKRHSKQNTIR